MGRTRMTALAKVLKGTAVSAAATIGMMALFALAIVFWNVSDGAISVINQLIKLLAILLGSYVAVGRGGEKGFQTGFVTAAAYMLAGYGMYVAFGGGAFSLTAMLIEIVIGGAAGALAGAVLANLAPRRKRARAQARS